MFKSVIVILVGGSSTGKSKFYSKYTSSPYYPNTNKCTPNCVVYGHPSVVFIDTPGLPDYRNKFEYSWQGIFGVADVILNFGNWSESEIYGEKTKNTPLHMTWSGDDEETMKRLQEYLQTRK